MDRGPSLDRFGLSARASRWPAVLGALLLPLLVGCPTEVPYETAAADASTEAPGSEATPPSGDPLIEANPPVEDRYATEDAAPPAEKAFPWESNPSEAPSDEAERLFGGADEPESVPPPADGSSGDDAAEEGSFGDFLGDAYAGMIDGPEGEAEADQETEVMPGPPAEEPSTAAETPKPPTDEPLDLDDFFGDAEPATEPPSDDVPDNETNEETAEEPFELPFEEPREPEATQQATPKPPTTVAPADSDLLTELWGDEDASPDSEPEPETAAAPEASAPEPLPEPLPPPAAEQPSGSLELPTAPGDDPPAPEPDPTPLFDEPAPVDLFEEPAAEPAQIAPTPITPATPRDGPPLVSSAIEPLPRGRLSNNTRHLAWLLGGRIGLSELADLDGATPAEVAEWSREARRLADKLRLDEPAPPRGADGPPAERVRRMMAKAAGLGAQLAEQHGMDHAALLEIALKSNALLVVAEQRPDLAGLVGTAIRDAADRARLPRFLWREPVKTLERNPTSEEVLEAVERLHKGVESFLR